MPDALFWKKYNTAAQTNNSWLVVGLDPVPEKLPDNLRGSPDGVLKFSREIIAATKDLVCAYKPNLAFFLALGNDGVNILEEVVRYIPEEIPVLLDAKFGDVPHTAERYANFTSKIVGADAVTLNPYIGSDSFFPFVEAGLGIFAICMTSNKGFSDIQTLDCENCDDLYKCIADKVSLWGDKWGVRIGLVVGATHPSNYLSARRRAPRAPFLVPGIGAQGGYLETCVKYGRTKDAFPPLISSSRSILYASSGSDFADAARKAAIELRDNIRRTITDVSQ
jgi:orotidine-5'-phosphate decarboxylase